MKGLFLLLQSFGIKITPEEFQAAWDGSKDALPKLATSFEEMLVTQKRIELKQDEILARLALIQEGWLNLNTKTKDQNQIVNASPREALHA